MSAAALMQQATARIDHTLTMLSSEPGAGVSTGIPSLDSLRERLKPFIKVALPFKEVRIAADLSVNPKLMKIALNAGNHEFIEEVLHLLSTHPMLKRKHYLGLPLEKQRAIVLEQLKVYVASGLFRLDNYINDPVKFIDSLALLSYHGPNLATKTSVNFGLFGGTVLALGTDKHKVEYMERIQRLQVRGGFALTELGHGSNARGIETTATYDAEKQQFIMNSPTETAQKAWIGNLACHCTHLTVFAQLHVNSTHRGVAVFLVRVRNDDGSTCQGVRIADCGMKGALNGIDNGRCWFDNMAVPLDSLLDRFGSLNPETGDYETKIKSDSARFTAMIGALVGGRVVVSQAAVHMSKVGLAIAIRYALSRTQFGPELDSSTEIPLLDHLSHQRRLFPLLAKTYALQIAVNVLKNRYGGELKDSKVVHISAAGLKPVCTWHRSRTLQECREATGGMGFAADNRICVLRNDSDIDLTWEGDNNVMLQQVASSLIKEFSEGGMFAHLKRAVNMEFRDQPKRATTNSTHLHDGDFFLNAMEYRESRLLRALVNKLTLNKSKGKFAAWNNCLDLVRELSLAHVDRIVIEQFVAEVDSCDPKIKPMMSALCSLHCLCTIQDSIGWFLMFKYFSVIKAKAIWTEINRLCKAIRPYAYELVESFGIPDQLLDAPIAGDWKLAYSYEQSKIAESKI